MDGTVFEMARPPRPEDFGLTDEMVKSAPRTLVGAHRGVWVAGLWALAAVATLIALLAMSGSIAASVAFTVVAIAAASVLLLPALTALVCWLEVCERCVLCRRHSHYAALMRYREAVEGYNAADRRRAAARARSGRQFWTSLPQAALVAEVERLFERAGTTVERLPEDRSAGFDLMLVERGRRTAVRCEAEPIAAGKALGHELAGARLELAADQMILVSPAGASDELEDFLASHEGTVLDAAALDRTRAAATA